MQIFLHIMSKSDLLPVRFWEISNMTSCNFMDIPVSHVLKKINFHFQNYQISIFEQFFYAKLTLEIFKLCLGVNWKKLAWHGDPFWALIPPKTATKTKTVKPFVFNIFAKLLQKIMQYWICYQYNWSDLIEEF